MEALLYTGLLAAILFCNTFLARWLAILLTVPFGPLLPFKPFNCDACLTFWFTLIGSLLISRWWVAPFECRHEHFHFGVLALLSVTIAFLNFFYIKSKFQINE